MEKSEFQFNVIFLPEPEGGFAVIVPSLPGCFTYGKTIQEAREMAIDAIRGYLFSLKKHGETIPFSDEANFISTVRLPKSKSLVYA